MPDPDPKSPFVPPSGGKPAEQKPSFDFLSEPDSAANDAADDKGMFDFGDVPLNDGSSLPPFAVDANPPVEAPNDAPVDDVVDLSTPPSEPAVDVVAAGDEADLAFFDDALGDDVSAEDAPPPSSEPAAAREPTEITDFDEEILADFGIDAPRESANESLDATTFFSPTDSASPEAPVDDLGFLDLEESTPPSISESLNAPQSDLPNDLPNDLPSDVPDDLSADAFGDLFSSAADEQGTEPERTIDLADGIDVETSARAASDLMPPTNDLDLSDALFGVAAVGAAAELASRSDSFDEPTAFEPPAAAVEEPLPPDPEIEETPATPPPLPDDHPQMQTYAKLCGHVRQASQLGAVEAVLGWDERCMMPAGAAENRAEQITLLSGIIHDRLVDPRIGEWLNELADGELTRDPHDDYGATIRQLRRQYEKRTKLPKSLVEELAHTAAMGQHVWQEARANDDFATFAPLLSKMVDLKRQQAEALGYAETPYDALLDEFEPGELTSRVTAVLGALRDELVPLVAQIRDGGRSPDLSILERNYPIEMQRTFGRSAAAKIGFDFGRGRLDITAHPFCTGLGPDDCRITTRYDENFFNSGFFGILHEAGHGIYDQGLRGDQYGLPVGEAVSMGIHESQSRMWEILVGRSLPFWRHFYPEARRAFPAALNDVTLGRFFFAVNDVRPSLIRVEADEFTYNLHILIRFELEQALISGDLAVADLPGAWREKYREYLGIECPNDADGVLQDIHWSAGLFGYFPTYSLGNLYAAQFYEQADRELGGLAQRFDRGEFSLLRRWLAAKIHRQGQRYTAAELCERITGGPLSHAPLMRHLRSKYEMLYAPEAASLDGLDVAAPAASALVADEPAVADVGGYGLAGDADVMGFGVAQSEDAAGGFASSGFSGGGSTATPAWKAKKKGGLLTAVVLIGGIVGGGIIGTSLGYWILLWWKGPSADFLKVRDSLPAWLVPGIPTPEGEGEPEKALPPRDDSSQPTTMRSPASDVGRRLTQRVLRAAAAMQQRG